MIMILSHYPDITSKIYCLLITIIRSMIHTLLIYPCQTLYKINYNSEQLANDINYIIELLCKQNPQNINHYVNYIMGDIIHLFDKPAVSNDIKLLLTPSINVLFDSSTKYELQQLFVTLNPSERFIYRNYFTDYEKYYKYKGVV